MAERILIIEDDDRLAAMLREYLGEHGFHVTHARNAAGGRELVRRERFDALILDGMLPDGDGFDLCREFRAQGELPIVMLTARGDETDRIVGLELGADDYLPKPFNPRELLARLRAVLRRQRRAAATAAGGAPRGDGHVLCFGRLAIDRDARVAQLDGRPLDLTAYQFELLRVLAERAGRVVSRERLIEELRGDALGPFDRSIDVHVSRIRAAIEDDPRRPRRIQTVRGVGYRFARTQDDEG